MSTEAYEQHQEAWTKQTIVCQWFTYPNCSSPYLLLQKMTHIYLCCVLWASWILSGMNSRPIWLLEYRHSRGEITWSQHRSIFNERHQTKHLVPHAKYIQDHLVCQIAESLPIDHFSQATSLTSTEKYSFKAHYGAQGLCVVKCNCFFPLSEVINLSY